MRRANVLFLLAALAACASTPVVKPHDDEARHFDVYYATDREYDADETPGDRFSGGRSKNGVLRYGVWPIHVPGGHVAGEPEDDDEWLQDTPRELSHAAFHKRVQGKPVFVFVHGYNETFRQSILLTSQLAHDLGFEGITVAYSWPSDGNPLTYTADESDAAWSVAHFRKFIDDLGKAGATCVHVASHSLGARVVAPALARPVGKTRCGQVVLAAPDIDPAVLRDLVPDFLDTVDRVTIYASRNDRSLQVSSAAHGGHDRAGTLSKSGMIEGVDVIDATGVDGSGFWGHKYYAEHRVVTDLYYLIQHNHPPERRFGLVEAELDGHTYWIVAR